MFCCYLTNSVPKNKVSLTPAQLLKLRQRLSQPRHLSSSDSFSTTDSSSEPGILNQMPTVGISPPQHQVQLGIPQPVGNSSQHQAQPVGNSQSRREVRESPMESPVASVSSEDVHRVDSGLSSREGRSKTSPSAENRESTLVQPKLTRGLYLKKFCSVFLKKIEVVYLLSILFV